MYSRSAKKYIEKIIRDKDSKEVINNCKNIVNGMGYKLLILKRIGYVHERPKASAIIPGVITINSAWIINLVDKNDKYINDIFLVTIGHELTHKDKEISKIMLNKNSKRFVSWVNEVHADFGGCQKMAGCNRQKLINSIDYKKNLKDIDKDSKSHPSWQRRLYYAENFDFNEQLIRQIAEDAGCKDERLIQKLCDYYDEIVLI